MKRVFCYLGILSLLLFIITLGFAIKKQSQSHPHAQSQSQSQSQSQTPAPSQSQSLSPSPSQPQNKTQSPSQTPPQFVVGQDYEIITPTNVLPINNDASTKNTIQVTEFFSYGCPWCYRLEPTIEKWLQTKPKNVTFDRVPVVFEAGWEIYAKAYYTAKSLNILDKITPALFNAIHQQGQNLASEQAMQDFFVKQGVSAADFNSVFDFSPGIGMELNRGKTLMLAYQVFEIPTFVIAGKYKTSIRMVEGNDEKLMQTISFLIQKAANEKK